MKRSRGLGLVLDPVRESLVSSSGGVLLRQTIRVSGVERALGAALASWRGARAVHDPGKVLLDVAVAVALGGDCAADIAVVRAQPEVFGPVASDPTVSRLIASLAAALPPTSTRRCQRFGPLARGLGRRCGRGDGRWAARWAARRAARRAAATVGR